MMISSSRKVLTSRPITVALLRQTSRRAVVSAKGVRRGLTSSTKAAAASATAGASSCSAASVAVALGAAAAATWTIASAASPAMDAHVTLLDSNVAPGGELIQSGVPVKEKSTGILFPQLCNGMYLAGCGVRVKYGFVKVYAVGTYVDPFAMSAVKKSTREAIEQALLDPTYPRTIRIVMNRGLSIEKYTAAIVEALEPRMQGKDLEKLDEFKKLNPQVDLVQGAEMEMTIRGDTLLYKNALGGVGTIRSEVFTKAMCDVYYGLDPVSPSHKQDVLDGIPKM